MINDREPTIAEDMLMTFLSGDTVLLFNNNGRVSVQIYRKGKRYGTSCSKKELTIPERFEVCVKRLFND